MKRPFALLVFLALSLCALAQVWAKDYSVMIVPQNQVLSSYMEAFFTSIPYDDAVVQDWANYDRLSQLKTLGEALDKAYSSEDGNAVEKARSAYEEALGKDLSNAANAVDEERGDFSVKYVGVPNSLGADFDIAKAVSENDSLSLQLACSLSGADMLVVPVTDSLGGFWHTAVYVYRKAYDSVELCFEIVSQEQGTLPAKAVLSLARFFFAYPVSLLSLDGIPQGSNVVVDGVVAPMVDGYMLVSSGDHTFEVSKQGYGTRRFRTQIPENEVCTIETSLSVPEYSPVSVDSHPASRVYYDGQLLGDTPLVVEGYTLPLVLRFSADGYSNKTISLADPVGSLFVELKPQWMDDTGLYEKAKDDFYGLFARSLLIFGLRIAAGSLGGSGSQWYEAAGIALDGALVLSLTDLAAKLIEYYRCSEYISP